MTGARSTQTSEFYTRTVNAVDARRKAMQEGLGSGSPVHDKAAREQIAAEAKVREGKGEIVLDKVPDHEGGKGEQVSHRSNPAAPAGGKQQPLADHDAEDVVNPKGKSKSKSKSNDKISKPYKADTGAAHDDDDDKADAVHGPVDADDKPGRKKAKVKGDIDDGVAKVGNTGKHVSDGKKNEKTAADHEVDALLDGILKKSPVIIFSKSYCPHSKKAKRILLENYKIVPAPFVHEIDLMEQSGSGGDDNDEPLGQRLQSKLYQMTKRRTVPNVLINGVSIGGGDDIEALHHADELADKILEIGGKRIMEVTRVVDKAHAKEA